jgi:DNA helicase HerA-like ATPase
MLNLTRQGRFKGVDLIFVSHNDTSIHPEIVQEANMVIAFGMKHPTRIERLRHFFDDPRILSSLQRYEYVVAYDQTGEVCMCNSTEDLEALRKEAPHIFAAEG